MLPLVLAAILSLSDPVAGLREIFPWFFMLILISSSSFLYNRANSSSWLSRGVLMLFRSFWFVILSWMARLSISSCLSFSGVDKSTWRPDTTAAGGEPVDIIPGG